MLAAAVLLAVACGSASAQPTAAPAHVIDGPDAAIDSLGGFSVARDGSGGLVYLKDVGGVAHVFVSRLLGGVFQASEQIDSGLPGVSSQPVIAAGNGGVLVIAFINSGQLIGVDRTSATSGYSAPADLASGAANPAISMTTQLGKAYVAFTASGAGGHDVRCAYYDNGTWGVEAPAMDASPGDDAGTGSGRPAVAAANDGVGIVAWGEAGHIYTRRVWGTSASIAFQQADWTSPINGWREVSADEPAIAAGNDSSYASVVFHEVLTNGVQQQSRVLAQRLQASRYDGLAQPDGLSTPGSEGADQPLVDLNEYADGFILSGRDTSHQLIGMHLGQNEVPGPVMQIDSLPNASAPVFALGPGGFHSWLIAWQQDPGPGASPEIRARFYDGASCRASSRDPRPPCSLDPEEVLSDPALGPVQASKGLLAAGDIAADMAAVWIQGTGASTQIVTSQMYQPPGSFGATAPTQYVRSTQPTLTWSPARQLWGPLRYDVRLDGALVAQTEGTSATLPNAQFPLPLAQGPHSWQVTVTNPAGLTRTDRGARFFIDTVAPVVTVKVTGRKRVGSRVRVSVRASDAPPPVPSADASGIAKIQIRFGDGASVFSRHGKYHLYRHARRYRVTVIVTDKAGNRSRVVTRIKIAPKPKPKKKKQGKHGH